MSGVLRARVGMLSCQQSQNVIDGKKRIILNPVCPLVALRLTVADDVS